VCIPHYSYGSLTEEKVEDAVRESKSAIASDPIKMCSLRIGKLGIDMNKKLSTMKKISRFYTAMLIAKQGRLFLIYP